MGQVLGSCERLVHARLTGRAARERQARLIALLLGAPFFLTALAAPLALGAWGANAAMSVAAVLFASSWMLAVTAASGRYFGFVAGAGLTLALFVGALGLWTGAPAPVVLLLALAMIGEAGWVSGARSSAAKAAMLGIPLAMAAFFADAPVGATATITGAAAALFYLVLALPRLVGMMADDATDEPAEPRLEDRIDAVLLTLTREGEAVSVSDQARRILHLEPDLLTGAGFFERVRVSDRVKLLHALSSDAAEPQHLHLTVRVPGKLAGDVAHLDVGLELVRGTDGWTAILRDATEIGDLRAALDDAADQAAALEIAKSRFLAAVSHELRTPLNAIIGFSDLLLHEAVSGPLPVKQAEHVGLIREAGNHLLAVVNSILDISKIEAGAYSIHPEPFELKSALELTVSLLEGQACDKGVALAIANRDAVGELDADQRAVHQILLNLVSNAIKFTPQGGRVTLSTMQQGDRIAIVVADTGIGIAADDLAGLGRPFAQVQNDYTRKFEGTGLGLSLVKGLVALHDGDLAIESAPGAGTTVTVSFPTQHAANPVTKLTTPNTNGQRPHGTFRKIA
ncbi:MAG: sensor histidine kinase [Aliihoeflea sp.]